MSEEPKVTKQFILEHTDENETDLSLCSISRVPVKELAKVPRGVKLDLSQNKLTHLPENFSSLTHLIKLDLSKNQIQELPENFGSLLHLQHLDLFGNKLVTLPSSFSELYKLKWLDLRNNNLESRLLKAAGDCLSEQECKQCAVNVIAFIKIQSAEEDKLKKKQLSKQRGAQRRRDQKEQQKLMEEKEKKALEKQRRREEWEKRKAEEDKKQEEEVVQSKPRGAKEIVEEGKTVHKGNGWKKCVCSLVWVCLGIVLLAVLLQSVYKDHSAIGEYIAHWKHQIKELTSTMRQS